VLALSTLQILLYVVLQQGRATQASVTALIQIQSSSKSLFAQASVQTLAQKTFL
jgi:hypothetical protein